MIFTSEQKDWWVYRIQYGPSCLGWSKGCGKEYRDLWGYIMEKKRCNFSFGTKEYHVSEKFLLYHDTRWCKPEHRDQELYAMLVLEGMQAGVSWNLVLKRRQFQEGVWRLWPADCCRLWRRKTGWVDAGCRNYSQSPEAKSCDNKCAGISEGAERVRNIW